MAQNGGLRPSPYSVFLHESCRLPYFISIQMGAQTAGPDAPGENGKHRRGGDGVRQSGQCASGCPWHAQHVQPTQNHQRRRRMPTARHVRMGRSDGSRLRPRTWLARPGHNVTEYCHRTPTMPLPSLGTAGYSHATQIQVRRVPVGPANSVPQRPCTSSGQ